MNETGPTPIEPNKSPDFIIKLFKDKKVGYDILDVVDFYDGWTSKHNLNSHGLNVIGRTLDSDTPDNKQLRRDGIRYHLPYGDPIAISVAIAILRDEVEVVDKNVLDNRELLVGQSILCVGGLEMSS